MEEASSDIAVVSCLVILWFLSLRLWLLVFFFVQVPPDVAASLVSFLLL